MNRHVKTFYIFLIAVWCTCQAYAQNNRETQILAKKNINKEIGKFLSTGKASLDVLLQIDSINAANKALKHKVDSLQGANGALDYANYIAARKFEFYGLISQFHKDSLVSLTKRFPNLLATYDQRTVIQVPMGVDADSLQIYAGKINMKQQFPKFYRALDSGLVIMEYAAGSSGPGIGNPNIGMQLPDIPVLASADDADMNTYKNLYNQYNDWMKTYVRASGCDPAYLTVFFEKESGLPPNSSWKDRAAVARNLMNFLMKKCP